MKRFQILLLFFSSCLLYGQGQTIPGLSSRFLKVKENDVYSKAQQGDKKAQFLVGTFLSSKIQLPERYGIGRQMVYPFSRTRLRPSAIELRALLL